MTLREKWLFLLIHQQMILRKKMQTVLEVILKQIPENRITLIATAVVLLAESFEGDVNRFGFLFPVYGFAWDFAEKLIERLGNDNERFEAYKNILQKCSMHSLGQLAQYTSPESAGVSGLKPDAAIVKIASDLGVSIVTVSVNLPYQNVVYKLENKSSNAKRCARYKERKRNKSTS